ncbi:MAG: hypothetical protein ACFNLH_06010 [Corynebacterium matruchotii]
MARAIRHDDWPVRLTDDQIISRVGRGAFQRGLDFARKGRVRGLGDAGTGDIISTPCEHPVDHTHSMVLILLLRRTSRSSIIQSSGSIYKPNPMTIITAGGTWCESMHSVPDQA